MKRSLTHFACLFWTIALYSQNVESPSDFLGYEHGSYFSRHHQVVDYFEQLEKNSGGSLQLTTYGETNEKRKLLLAYISTPENLKNIDAIKAAHANGDEESVAIVWLSYNVHGNESSATEAAMQTAYDLISEKQDWLKNTLVIIDPCLNPDGRDRYVNWYNQKKNSTVNTDAFSEEHDESWPSGRFNHYLFDLNRDWVWLTQVESQQRMKVYNEWLPHVHVDFHEQGINDPYYFAPAAEPMHENITDWQREYQFDLGVDHAAEFDENGWLYFTREIFDLLYPSYGDTYPTFNGAIGMTYEQGGSGEAGLDVINHEHDHLTLKDRIAHHVSTGLNTVEFSATNKSKLIEEYLKHASNQDFKYKSYVLSGDVEKMSLLIELLNKHDIEYQAGSEGSAKGYNYATGEIEKINTSFHSLVVSTQQKKGTLVNVLFEPSTYLHDSLTYDITAWSLPYAYGLDCIASEKEVTGIRMPNEKMASLQLDPVYAYLIPWNSTSDAKLLSALLKDEIRVRYAKETFSFGDDEYAPGTLIIRSSENDEVKDLAKYITKLCIMHGVQFETTETGMVTTGKDFGSDAVSLIDPIKVGLISGDGVSPTRAGEIWNFFENELQYPLTVFNNKSLSEDALNSVDVLIVPNGWYNFPSSTISTWTENGGKVIAIGGALSFFANDSLVELTSKEDIELTEEEEYANAHIHQSERHREYLTYEVKGAVYKCKVDPTHPLAYGYDSTYFTLKIDATAYDLLPSGDNAVYIDEDVTPTAGFAGAKAQRYQGNSLVFGSEYYGNGSYVYMVDNPLYRGFWENGKLFFVNAVFFGN